ncbi:MAG: hypothetical protein LWW97_03225 [Deltaproteobacteria bacterium]|nr:hypothetical protein [Deltaproteobacteria bacterium]
MADIISLDTKLQLTRDKKANLIKKRKILAVQKVFQCTRCSFKCEKCGSQISLAHQKKNDSRSIKVSYQFCEGCMEEFNDYIEKIKEKGDSGFYWHNDAWIDVWKTWIDHQNAISQYLKSKEFKQLLQEFKQNEPNK